MYSIWWLFIGHNATTKIVAFDYTKGVAKFDWNGEPQNIPAKQEIR